MFFKKWREGGGLRGMLSGEMAGNEPIPMAGGWNDYGDPGMGPSQDDLDFRKEFMQSMFGGKKLGGQDSVGSVAVGGGMRNFETNPLMTTPEVGQYAPTPGFSLVQPLKKKHWYS